MADWDLLLRDACIATMQHGEADYGTIEDGAIAIADGRIAWLGATGSLPQKAATETRSLAGQWITPALIDCHTHLVFGGDRSAEFEQRLQGASYEDIARAGGGILSTVRATREASAEELYEASLPRLRAIVSSGVATIEIKSGYGLDVASEIKMLEVARRLGDSADVDVQRDTGCGRRQHARCLRSAHPEAAVRTQPHDHRQIRGAYGNRSVRA